MPVNITIPTAVMITCDGDQFPVGIIIEAQQNSSNQPGTKIHTDICILHTYFDQIHRIKEAFSETMLFTVSLSYKLNFFVGLISSLNND